jgi:tetratricopeptide (TPR) repeat protein
MLSMNNLAGVYQVTGRFDRAIPLFEQTFTWSLTRLGKDHPDTLLALNNIAVACQDAGQLHRAIPLLEQVVEARRIKLGEAHRSTLTTQTHLAQAYEKAHRFKDAETLYRLAIAVAGRSKPRNDRLYSDLLAGFGGCLVHDRKIAEAVPILRECLEIKDKIQADDWTTANARSLLGEALAGQKAYEEAEPLLLNAQKALAERQARIRPIDRDSTLHDAVERLMGLYEALGNTDKAAEWHERLKPSPAIAGKARP